MAAAAKIMAANEIRHRYFIFVSFLLMRPLRGPRFSLTAPGGLTALAHSRDLRSRFRAMEGDVRSRCQSSEQSPERKRKREKNRAGGDSPSAGPWRMAANSLERVQKRDDVVLLRLRQARVAIAGLLALSRV